MTLLQRAVAITVASLSLAGLAWSAPGLAAEMDRTAITAPALAVPVLNPGAPIMVPAAAVPATSVTPVATPATLQTVQTIPTEEAEYDTLADAIAAQDVALADDGADGDALRCLASAIYFESKGEPVSGQLAVAEVIINRTKSGRFPTDLCSVVTQRGQFSFVRGGQIPSIAADNAAFRRALAVAKVAIADAWDSPADDALYFNTANRRPAGRLTRIASIGNHVFYR